ncbi:MAG: cyclic nucleotide-binding domain-containing protein [Actinobacteria bacterium]|nr:cyclic nucleotide-binding domain-containing protein [Actinomycetota bacterium]
MAGAPLELLQRVPLFADLDRRELQQVAESMKQRTFKAGDVVAQEGSGGVGFFVIEDGQARVTVRGAERGALGPGDYFGEIALISEGERSATVTAETDLRCYGMTPWNFRPLVEQNAGIAWKMLQILAQKLRQAERGES